MENKESLATELLHEVKMSAKRWFIIALIELVIIFGMVGMFIWYISLPVEVETIEIESDDGNANYIGHDGEINNGENQGYKK